MAIAELVMPKLGESIMEATILKWHKKVGDPVQQDETVLDIATDKVDSEVPSTAEGIITEILFNPNDVVPIGTVIAKISTNAAEATATIPVQETTATTTTTPVEAIAPPSPETSQQPDVVELPIEEVPYTPQPTELLSKPAGNRFYSPLV